MLGGGNCSQVVQKCWHAVQHAANTCMIDEMLALCVCVCVCVCVCERVPPRLWGSGSAIRCELGRIKNESAVMHY